MSKNKNFIYTIALFFMFIDQLIKYVIINNLALHDNIPIIKNFFSIYYLKNTGAAFSILGNKTILLVIISVICLFVFKEYIKKISNQTLLTIISLGMIIGGILGNLIDRLLYNGVIDYLSFVIFNKNFPVFNFADIGITVGAFLFILDIFINDRKSIKEGDTNE